MRGKALLGLGWAAYLESDFQTAFDHLNQAAALCGQEDIQNRTLAESLLGLALMGLDEREQAVRVIEPGMKLCEAGEQVIIEKPQIFWSYYWILGEVGRHSQAEQWLQAGKEIIAAQAQSLKTSGRFDITTYGLRTTGI
jgi:hypothetical protein